MIEKLNLKHKLDVYEFVMDNNDVYQDFYVTINKERKFIKDWDIIHKLIHKQEFYGYFDSGMKGCMIILREKGFRTYLKLFAIDRKFATGLIKFLNWNYKEEIFVKIKKDNWLCNILQKNRFRIIGFRGKEILLKKEKEVQNANQSYIKNS